jgi:hypothetical protein
VLDLDIKITEIEDKIQEDIIEVVNKLVKEGLD